MEFITAKHFNDYSKYLKLEIHYLKTFNRRRKLKRILKYEKNKEDIK